MKTILKTQLIRLFRLHATKPSKRLCRMIVSKFTETYGKLILLLMLILFSSCGSIQINGIRVKQAHQRKLKPGDVVIVAAVVAVGVHVGQTNNLNKSLKP